MARWFPKGITGTLRYGDEKIQPTKQKHSWAKPIPDRFWPKVDVKGPDECWPWLACTNRGKAKFFYIDHAEHAHRIAWILTHGEIPDNHAVRHTCLNINCCNPQHLYLREYQKRR